MKYFDYAATCPIDDEALDTYVKASKEYFGNTSSLHDIGSKASALLEDCRQQLGQMLGVNSKGIYYTSGGSESNTLAIRSLLSAKEQKGKHIITSMAEHSSIHSLMDQLKQEGYHITNLPFNNAGTIDINELNQAITPDTVLVVVQHVNGEIGTIQPIKQIGELCTKQGIYLHTDCVQSFGKVDVKSIIPFVTSLSLSSHKIYGPKGIGAVYINPEMKWNSVYPNTSHEKGFRPGTVNVPAIAGFTVAAYKCVKELEESSEHFTRLRKNFKEDLKDVSERLTFIEGPDTIQMPSVMGICITGIEGQWVMLELNRLGFAISTGSACQVGKQAASKTMLALGMSEEQAKQFVRISFGKLTKIEDVKALTQSIRTIISAYN